MPLAPFRCLNPQLDRFLMRIELGVPDRASETGHASGMDRRDMLKELKPVMNRER